MSYATVSFVPSRFKPQILFAGLFVPPALIPVWLRWLAYVFPLTYAVNIAVVAEFNKDCPGADYCAAVMSNVQAYPDCVWWYWLVLVCQFVFFRLLGLLLLRQKASRFY